MPEIHITLTPDEVKEIPDDDLTIIMIDTLRASTTIVTALANGAKEIRPFMTSQQLEEYFKANSDADLLLCGENLGKPISGFNLGNSPLEYPSQVVANKILLLKTTNGTRLFFNLNPDNKILIGALVNSKGVARKIMELAKDVYLVCAGTRGSFSLEDYFAAGRLSSLLLKEGWQSDDLAIITARIFENNQSYEEIVNLFCHSRNGQNLMKLGYEADIQFASQLDIFSVVPIWNGEKIIL